jgi:phage terminase large subunit
MELELPYCYSPRLYQIPLWQHFVESGFERKRALVIAHRRWGKDLFALNLASVASQQRMGTYWHVLPFKTQARAVVWNGIDSHPTHPRKFRDYFHPRQIAYTNENEMRIHMVNGSVWQAVGGDDFDKLVGTNPVGITISEYALVDPNLVDYLRPILRENKGWLLLITTIRGKNHAYKMAQNFQRRQTQDPNYLYVNQTVNDTKKEDGTPVITAQDIESDRAEGSSESIIRQEYFNDPEIPIEGAYYITQLMKCREEGRVCSIPYDPKILVNTYWDLGFGDFTVILFVQSHGFEHRVIDVYANTGEIMAHYARVLKEKGYTYGEHYAPWDVEIKDLKSEGRSIYDIARGLGIKFRVTPQPKRVEDGIEQVRNMFPMLWFDGGKCERLLEALSGYRKEPLPEKLQPTQEDEHGRKIIHYKDKAVHSWESHYADAIRVMAWNIRRKEKTKVMQEKAEDNFSYV